MEPVVPRLRLEHITKTYPGVRAVNDVTLEAYPGEVLALVGENGAGKTTLMNILSGAVQPDTGVIWLDGQPVKVDNPRSALDLGISMIHQELALIPQLDAARNMFLGREPRRRTAVFVDWKRLEAEAARELQELGIDLPLNVPVSELSVAQQQLVEIAKALSLQARIIILDEPTSSLSDKEAEALYRLIRDLKSRGVTLIFVSHRMEEVFAVSDRVAIMRDGSLVAVSATSETTPEQVVRAMVGRELQDYYSKRMSTQAGEVVLEVRHLRRGREVRDVSFVLRRGEIVGMAGLVGAGRSNVARILFGIDRPEAGEILLEGKPVELKSPQDAIERGVGYVPEDRKAQGLFLAQSVRSNLGVILYRSLSRLSFVKFSKIGQLATDMSRRLNIRTPSLRQKVRYLSGGNQQKVLIARWLELNPKVLILDEPTRGVDVGAKAEIHALIGELAAQGKAILMISSELPEVLGVSDRVLVMHEGRIVAEFSREEATQDKVMEAATGQLETETQVHLSGQGASHATPA